MNGIPSAVLRQKEEALERQRVAEDAQAIANQPIPTPEQAPPAEQPAPPEPNDRSNSLDHLLTGEPSTVVAPPPVATQQPAQPVVEQEVVSLEDHQALVHRLNVLQGKYDAEVPRYADEVRDLKERESKLQEELRHPREPAWRSGLTDQERQELADSPDGLGVDYRAAKGEVNAVEQKLSERQRTLEKRLDDAEKANEQFERKAATDRFFDRVERITPGARQIDERPDFADWLKRPDPDSNNGSTLLDVYLSDARQGRISQVAATISEFQEQKGLVRETPSPSVRGQVKPAVASGSSPTTPQAPSSDETITGTQLKQFMTDVSKGNSVYTPEQKTKIMARIEHAEANGLIDRSR